VTVRQLIPPDLATMPPGPELGALLAGMNISALTGVDVVEVLRARARQLSHEQARLLTTMVESRVVRSRRHPEQGGPVSSVTSIRGRRNSCSIDLDPPRGGSRTRIRRNPRARMPAVLSALDTGRIDRSKAWVFADLCADLTPEQAETVCSRLLSDAERLTTGELAARIKKLAIALDPEWATRRYATAVRERNVIG
jgi:hypothetical protein